MIKYRCSDSFDVSLTVSNCVCCQATVALNDDVNAGTVFEEEFEDTSESADLSFADERQKRSSSDEDVRMLTRFFSVLRCWFDVLQ